ncbi:MAG: ATPase [Burkholderiales bacterium]|nr:ATPase [Burkholderiales bacterium]
MQQHALAQPISPTSSFSPATAASSRSGACAYLIGVDGGGTGTRVALAGADGEQLGRGSAGPSGLAHGVDRAWQAILAATAQAFANAGLGMPDLSAIAAGCGLAGINNRLWAQVFVQQNPGFAVLLAETDAYTSLLGAHGGKPGAIIALGTGSVGEVLQADGRRREVGGWGFPVSDEAGGAWLGQRAINHLQRALDGRRQQDALAAALLAHCGGSKDALFSWLAQANQTRYAELAPLVIRYAGDVEAARQIMLEAGREVELMAQALDPCGELPLALCGGLATPLWDYLPPALLRRVHRPHGDAAAGALILIRRHVQRA